VIFIGVLEIEALRKVLHLIAQKKMQGRQIVGKNGKLARSHLIYGH